MMTPQSRNADSISWSKIYETVDVTEDLRLLCQSEVTLQQEGYVRGPLANTTLWGKMRCLRCGTRMMHYLPHTGLHQVTNRVHRTYNDDNQNLRHHPQALQSIGGPPSDVAGVVQAVQTNVLQSHSCLFHSGRIVRGLWSCCRGQLHALGCRSTPEHTPRQDEDHENYWSYYQTPSFTAPPLPVLSSSNHKSQGRYYSANLNDISSQNNIRTAVALDCEMGTAVSGDSELIRLTLVDFFSSEVLLDRLVNPSVPMAHYNTRYSGVTFSAMNAAVQNHTCIFGRDAAREQIFRYVGPETVVVVHGGQNDFTALRWIHHQIIDTFILEPYDPDNPQSRSLKSLSARKLGLVIQNARGQNGRMLGHDSFEDAMAARELVIWWLMKLSID